MRTRPPFASLFPRISASLYRLMSGTTDCLIIGHNEMAFDSFAQGVARLGDDSPPYRDLKLSFIRHHGVRRTVTDVLSELAPADWSFRLGSVFSTTVAYLASYLARNGHTFECVNDFQHEKASLVRTLEEGNVVCVAITTTLYTHPAPLLEVCELVRKHSRGARMVIGGPYVFNLVHGPRADRELEQFLRATGADVLVASSEGERTLGNLIRAFKQGKPIDELPNVTYWKDGACQTNRQEEEGNPLDENSVDWGLFSRRVGNWAAVRTSVSCPFNCFYCGFGKRAGKFRLSSVDSVERELDSLSAAGTVRSINFVDSTFNYPVDRFKSILRMMIRRKYPFKWNGYLRVQFLDEEAVALMEDSGCEGVYLGFESGSQKILQAMRKGAKVSQYREKMSLLKRTNIVTHGNYLVGFLGETRETFQETVAFIKDIETDYYRVQLWYLDPVTPVWQVRAKYGTKGSCFMWTHDTTNSQEVCDWIEELFMQSMRSIWLPIHNFNFHNMFRLVHSGMRMEDTKGFLRGFQAGIRENIGNGEKRGVSDQVLKTMEHHVASSLGRKESTDRSGQGCHPTP